MCIYAYINKRFSVLLLSSKFFLNASNIRSSVDTSWYKKKQNLQSEWHDVLLWKYQLELDSRHAATGKEKHKPMPANNFCPVKIIHYLYTENLIKNPFIWYLTCWFLYLSLLRRERCSLDCRDALTI